MNRPRILVDFNELVTPDELLLSKGDAVVDSKGNTIVLSEDSCVYVYCEEFNKFGERDNLIADGFATRNFHGG